MIDGDRIRILEKFGDEEIEVIFRRSPSGAPEATQTKGSGFEPPRFYPPLNRRTYVEDGIRVDQDVPVVLRDGVTIYLDIYRPDGPAGVSESPGHPRLGVLRQAAG